MEEEEEKGEEEREKEIEGWEEGRKKREDTMFLIQLQYHPILLREIINFMCTCPHDKLYILIKYNAVLIYNKTTICLFFLSIHFTKEIFLYK